jgi:hypothetical protein
MDFRRLNLAAGILFSVASGAYLGLYACGSDAWHWELHGSLELLIATVWTALTVLADKRQAAGGRRPYIAVGLGVGVYFVLHAIFMMSMAVVGPFYPAPPGSLNEWWQGFLLTWLNGIPC